MTGKLDKTVVDGKFPKQPLNEIVSFDANAQYGWNTIQRYNPDMLVGRSGLRIYKEMRLDEQVKAVMNFKRDAIFARGWQFSFGEGCSLSPDEQEARCAVFCRIVDEMPGSFVDGLNCIATGRDFGYSLTEKVYTPITVDGKTYVGLGALLGRDPASFLFRTDEYGVLQECKQRLMGREIPIDLNKFIHYVHSPEFDQYFGRSDLREAYKAWFWKTRMMEQWMVYSERLGGGLAVASIGPEADGFGVNTAPYQNLVAAMSSIKSSSSVVLPKGVTMDVHFPPTTDHYQAAVEFWDLAIARSLLVPNLLGVSHNSKVGSLAQSQTQLEAFFWTLTADKARLEGVINEQLFDDLGDQNWGDGEYPEFTFKELSSDRLKWITETIVAFAQQGVIILTEDDERWLRSAMELPERTEDSVPLAKAKMDLGIAPDPNAMATPPEGTEPPEPGNKEPPSQKDEPPDVAAMVRDAFAMQREELKSLVTTALEAAKPTAHKFDASLDAAKGRAETRVHFSVIQDRQLAAAQSLTDTVATFVARATSGLLGSDEDLTKIEADPALIADLEFSTAQKGKLKETFKKSLATAYSLGRDMATNEMDRAKGQHNRMHPDMALPMERQTYASIRDKASEFFEANGFRMAGNVSDTTRAIIQGELQNAVKYGKSPKQARVDIWDALTKKGLTNIASVRSVEKDAEVTATLEAGWMLDEASAAPYLDTLARTNLFEAMNEARFAEFTDPALGDFVQALQYSAILDERTTEICTALDQHVYAADSDVWDTYRPPNHYNCRSILVPITSIDGWDGTESDPPDVQPQEGFK